MRLLFSAGETLKLAQTMDASAVSEGVTKLVAKSDEIVARERAQPDTFQNTAAARIHCPVWRETTPSTAGRATIRCSAAWATMFSMAASARTPPATDANVVAPAWATIYRTNPAPINAGRRSDAGHRPRRRRSPLREGYVSHGGGEPLARRINRCCSASPPRACRAGRANRRREGRPAADLVEPPAPLLTARTGDLMLCREAHARAAPRAGALAPAYPMPR